VNARDTGRDGSLVRDSDPRRLQRRTAGTVAAVGLSVATGAAAIRVLIPLTYVLREDRGILVAAASAFAVFLSPMLAAPLRRIAGTKAASSAALAGLALTVVSIQFLHPIPLELAATATVFALVTWTLLLYGSRMTSSDGGEPFAIGVVMGLGLDAAIHGLFRTWDPAWQSGSLAAVAGTVLIVGIVATIPTAVLSLNADAREAGFGRVVPVGVLGPFLLLQLLFFANIAFVASAAGLSMIAGATVVLAGATLSVGAMAWRARRTTLRVRIFAGIALAVLAWLVTGAHGLTVVAIVLAADALSGPMLMIALSGGGAPDRSGAWRTSVITGVGTSIFLALAFLYQIYITNPLPFSNRFLPVGAALLLGLGAIRRGPESEKAPRVRRLVAVPLALLLITIGVMFVTRPSLTSKPGDGRTLRVLDWNIHSAVNAAGQLDPAGVAQEIDRQHPDVVVLQEVARGWLIAGTTDLAEWLSMHEGLRYAWAPAADGQFGNLVLSRFPIVQARAVPLPYGAGPQHRSFVQVTLDVGGGRQATVVGAHLETKAGTDTRAKQIRAILADVGEQDRTIIAGDMNMQPTDVADVALFEQAGFKSAQDTTGHSSLSSSRDPNFPGDRPDWIFGSRDLTFSRFSIPPSTASDHLPLVVTSTL
jgi:endonuclease/exonuclease/phosphatase family metal-dependent hydrolase